MPTYAYACTECDHTFDMVQRFTDDTLTTCPQCSGRLRKVYGSVGVTFKGSGFYRTDSRASSHMPAASSSSTSKSADSAGSSSSSDSGSSSSSGSGSSGSSAGSAGSPAGSTAAAAV